MSERLLALVVAGGLLVAAAGCSSSPSSTSASGGGAADSAGGGGTGDPTIKVTVTVTGDVTASGTADSIPATYSGTDYTSCAAYGKGENREGKQYFVLPRNLQGDIGGKQVMVGAEIQDYRGPAAYSADQLTDQGSEAGIDFAGKLYFIGEGATSTATVDAKGGGKWEFTNLSVQNTDNTQTSGKLSGSVSWTCADG